MYSGDEYLGDFELDIARTKKDIWIKALNSKKIITAFNVTAAIGFTAWVAGQVFFGAGFAPDLVTGLLNTGRLAIAGLCAYAAGSMLYNTYNAYQEYLDEVDRTGIIDHPPLNRSP